MDKMNGGRTMKSRMDCKPPPPPSAGAVSVHKTKSARRPKTPPPRRPPRPVVKEKEEASHMRTTSESLPPGMGGFENNDGAALTADSGISKDGAQRSAESSTSNDVRDTSEKGILGSSEGAGRSSTTGHIVDESKPLVESGRSRVIRVPLNRNKRKAPDVPRTSRQVGSGGEGDLHVSSQKGIPDGWRLVSKSFSPADLTAKEASQCLDTLRLRKGSLDDDVLTRSKPVVQYVKIVQKDRGTDPINLKGNLASVPSLTESKSVSELDRYGIFLDLSDISCDYFYDQAFRSSFLEEVTLKRQTIGFHSDIQTLLKHSHKDDEHIYSLPQPQSYSDETLKAVKLITDKYDTLQRRRLHAASFREGDLAKLRGTLTLHRELSQKDSSSNTDGGNPDSPLPASPVREEKDAEDIICDITGLSKKDILRLEMFYRGCDTEVMVCPCLADLFLGNAAGSKSMDWLLYYTGVPIWVLNTGEGQRRRELHVFLAERETGFPLWKDKINYLTNLEAMQDDPKILTMRLSGSLSKMAKFNIFCKEASIEFHKRFVAMTSDPSDELWCVSQEHRREGQRSQKKKRKKRKSFTTHDISQPCNFQHIAKLDPADPQVIAAIALLMGTNTELAKGRNSSLPTSVASQLQNVQTEHLTV